MALVSRLFDGLIDFLALLACLLICLLTGSVALNVIMRALNLGNLSWALEGSQYMLYGVTFLGAPWVLRSGGHISIDVFLQQMPQRAARALEMAANLSGMMVALVLFYYGTRATVESYRENVIIYFTLVFPEWWILWVMPLTGFCLVGEFIRRLARDIRGWSTTASGEF
jgi:TRAP-type C4-dicarboxylate transport system permease small subunit